MIVRSLPFVPLTLLSLILSPTLHGEESFQSLFDGESLQGWKGAEGFWKVEDGAIVGQTTPENPTPGNTFLVWQGGEVSDFEFVCQVRFEGNNSGVQYRSDTVDEAGVVLRGYQADLHPRPEYFGMMYGEKFGKRGIIATRHQRIEIGADGEKKVLEAVDPSTTLVPAEWNELRIVAVGDRLVHLVNGVVTVDIADRHPEALSSGRLGLQLHAGPPMKAEFKNLRYRALSGDLAEKILAEAANRFPEKKVASAPGPNIHFEWVSTEPKAQWIWREDQVDNEPIYLRQAFEIEGEIKEAHLYTTCDNEAKVWINGKQVGNVPDWGRPLLAMDAKRFLRSGPNQVAVEARNRGGIAAFHFKLEIESPDGAKQHVLSTPDWKLALAPAEGWRTADFDDSDWNAELKSFGSFGVKPWGIAGKKGPDSGRQATQPTGTDALTVAENFEVDLLYTVPKQEQGSWVSLCKAPDGGFYASDQGGAGLFHILVSEGGAEVTRVPLTEPDSEKPLSGAQGMVWAFDSLWFHRNGGHLFRITDSDGDGSLDQVERQPSSTGGGEHGNHAVLVDETGEQLYIVGGNSAPIPPEDSIGRNRIQSWDEDHLLPRMWDARGHARGRLAPGGWISRYDPESKTHDLIAMGFRNQYDAALNSAGDLFAYDADMEWDIGNYWYRPTRINFAASGSDQGWRSGTGKWPTYYEDSLPPVVEIGPGSPTGLLSGKDSKFPERFQRALFALDWTFGTIWAVHLEQDGAGYRGEKELFVAGVPLPVTDGVVGADGNLYFTVGGRGTQSAFYRVRYTGSASTDPAPPLEPTEERRVARELETFHGVEDPDAIDVAWTHLSSEDRFLRHAARVAIESQPASQWASRVFEEEDPQALVTGAVALARSGEAGRQPELLDALLALDLSTLTKSQKLGALRALALTFVRLENPDEEQREATIAKLDPLLPSGEANLNTELIRLLSYLQSPSVVEKTIALIENRPTAEAPDWAEIAARNPRYGATVSRFLEDTPPAREVYYAMMIASVRKGWTLDHRRTVIELLNEAAKSSGGASFPGFLANIRDLHLGAMSNEDRAAVADISGENFNPVPDFELLPIEGPGRAWTVEEASKHLRFRKADFERGRSLFFTTTCGACHRQGGLGGDVGPDLTSIPNKFDANYVLEAIIHPSRDISDQYGMFEVTMQDGGKQTGLVVENGDRVSIYPPDHTAEPTVVPADEVVETKQLPVSQMPPGLINSLNPEELRDLMAYLMSGGNPESRVYGK